jgi:mannose-6-phosphate isomerase-like protein (cupin superfamily)
MEIHMPHIDNAAAPSFDIAGVTFTAVASPSRGTSENAMWRASVAPHTEGVPHHMTREEIIFAVDGTGVVRIAGTDYPLQRGDAFAVPAFTEFQLESATDHPFEALVILPVGGRAVIGTDPAFPPPWSL